LLDSLLQEKMISYQVRMQCNNLRVSLFSLQSRWLSSTSINDLMTVVQLSRSGGISEKQMSIENILQIVPKKIPLRDLRMLVRHSSSNVKKIPSLLPRPSSSCYILDIEHIRILCFPDKCLIFDPEREIVQNFLKDLCLDLQYEGSRIHDLNTKNQQSSITNYYKSSLTEKESYFEHIVLESSLSNVTKKFKRHLEIIKPALDVLLQQIAQDPATYNLRRLLAFRKSLSEFEQNVSQCLKLVKTMMSNDEDMVGLYLTKPQRNVNDHEELELLLESYFADFEEIEAEIKTFKEMIEDTNQFISAHLDSVRNKMIRLSLFMEMGALALGSGAVVGGIFGMNLTHGLENHPSAFFITLTGISVIMTSIFVGFNANYNKLKVDTTSAQSFLALKNFFTYVDDLEFIVNQKKLNQKEFKEALNKLTGLQVTDEESNFIFKMFDTNKDGYLHTEKELNIKKNK